VVVFCPWLDLTLGGCGGGVVLAEVVRRKLLEANPVSSNNEEPVVFDTSIVPWWAWVKRFHLPEAELLNGECLGAFACALQVFMAGRFNLGDCCWLVQVGRP
jgi:hypothetical protein